MRFSNTFQSIGRYRLPLAFCTLLLTAGAQAAGSAKVAGTGNYQQERADCISGKSAEDKATCLREAGAAQQDARRGKLANDADYQKNAALRCQSLPATDRSDCERRVSGEGATSGSVSGGGVYRELRTTIPAPAEGEGSK
jgi:hypothetical protein